MAILLLTVKINTKGTAFKPCLYIKKMPSRTNATGHYYSYKPINIANIKNAIDKINNNIWNKIVFLNQVA